jgi:hypothetical protein
MEAVGSLSQIRDLSWRHAVTASNSKFGQHRAAPLVDAARSTGVPGP